MMGKKSGYLAMRNEQVTRDLVSFDVQEFVVAANKLAIHAIKLGGLLGFGTSVLEWIASFAAIYLLVLDQTKWKTNIPTGLLIPDIFFSFPSLIFNILRGDVWITGILSPKPSLPRIYSSLAGNAWGFAASDSGSSQFICKHLKGQVGVAICLVIACYLLQERIRASGGFRNSFTKANGVSNSVGIIILLVYPVWALITDFIQIAPLILPTPHGYKVDVNTWNGREANLNVTLEIIQIPGKLLLDGHFFEYSSS